MKLVRAPRCINCFVEFTDLASAMAVHHSLQGAILQSSDRGGIRIQYSKNPFGKKRDASGNLVDLRNHVASQLAELDAATNSAGVTVTDFINNCATNNNGASAATAAADPGSHSTNGADAQNEAATT
ncbi:unnamed protein product [Ostreobium quekettii]|uniref:RRM domain-containing protein n=1 Tax=Ostreobium quekettii TaxID=121088 RepID=A0A8S1ISB7_9CHLO|nr:unnamed protein product [Ostreobium quekettii]